jgi:Tfp pilus assembly protein PilN
LAGHAPVLAGTADLAPVTLVGRRRMVSSSTREAQPRGLLLSSRLDEADDQAREDDEFDGGAEHVAGHAA